MNQKPWHHPETESEESEETGSSEDETDEEEEKQKYVRKENEKRRLVSPAWKKENSSEEDSESESGGAVSSPSREGKKQKDPRLAGSGSDSESESDMSSDEAKRSIGRLWASDRKPSSKKSTAEAPPPKKVQVQKEDPAKKEKSESQRRKRDNQKDEEGNAVKRRKEDETRSPTEGGKSRAQPAQETFLIGQKSKKEKKATAQNGQMATGNDKPAQKKKGVKETAEVQPVDRDGAPGKKPRKQKFSYDDGQNQDSEKSVESDRKQMTEEIEQGLSKKNAKKERSLEKKERASEHKEVVSEKKNPNPKLENGIESKFPSKAAEAAKEVASPQKPKKPSIWTPKDETALVVAVLRHVRAGSEVPARRNDEFWSRLLEELHGKTDGDWTKEQFCEKLRRMKQRYHLMVDRMQAEAPKPYKHRTAHEESLFKIWTHIWGKEVKGGQEGDEEEEDEDDAEAEWVKHRKLSGSERNTEELILKKPETSAGQEWIKPVRKLSGSEKKIEEIVMKKPETPVDQRRERMDSSDDETDDEQVFEANSTGMGIDHKQSSLPLATTMVPKPSDSSLDAVLPDHNRRADYNLLHLAQAAGDSSIDDVCKFLQAGNQTLLKEMQSSCKQMLEETQAKTLTAVERAIKVAGEKFCFFNGTGLAGPSSFGIPVLAGGDFMDLKFLKEDDTAHSKLRGQLYKQHIEELEVYSKRLSLIKECCHLQLEQLKSQFGTGKG